MNSIIVIWIVWAVLTVVLLALLLYRISISQYEEDRLFLDGENELQRHQQDEMLAKLKRLHPAIRICGGAAGIVTIILVGFYVLDALRQF